jgi:hypothetical protein
MPSRAQTLRGRGHLSGVGVESVDDKPLVGAQGRREHSIPATEMDHQPAFDTAELQDLTYLFSGTVGRSQRSKCRH